MENLYDIWVRLIKLNTSMSIIDLYIYRKLDNVQFLLWKVWRGTISPRGNII